MRLHTAVVGSSVTGGGIGQEDGAASWMLLAIPVPRIGEWGQVGGPHKAGQVHLLPLLHAGCGPHLHAHSCREMGEGVQAGSHEQSVFHPAG